VCVLLFVCLAACIDDDRPDARIPLGPEIDASVTVDDGGTVDAEPADAGVAD
jgi:hypothetical protein